MICRVFIEAEMILFCVYAELHIVYRISFKWYLHRSFIHLFFHKNLLVQDADMMFFTKKMKRYKNICNLRSETFLSSPSHGRQGLIQDLNLGRARWWPGSEIQTLSDLLNPCLHHCWWRRKSFISKRSKMRYFRVYFAWKDLERDKYCLL